MEFLKIGGDEMDVIAGVGAHRVAGHLNFLPGGHAGVNFLLGLVDFLFDALHFALHIDILVLAEGAEFRHFLFEFEDGLFEGEDVIGHKRLGFWSVEGLGLRKRFLKQGIEIAFYQCHTGVARFDSFGKAFHDNIFEFFGNIFSVFVDRVGFYAVVDNRPFVFGDAVGFEGFVAAEKFVGGDTEGEDLGAFVDDSVDKGFGCEIGGGAGEDPHFYRAGTFVLHAEIEIDQEKVDTRFNEHVFGFQVHVQISAAVDIGEGRRELADQSERVLFENRVLVQDAFPQVFGFMIFNHHVRNAINLSILQDGYNAGVIQFFQDFQSFGERFAHMPV